MKCPFGKIACESGSHDTVTECWESECGFWDKEKNQCGLLTFFTKKHFNDEIALKEKPNEPI